MIEQPTLMLNAQLRWACRRGMLELDLIFERYYDQALARASLTERAAFEALLRCQDQELYEWLVKRDPAPPAFAKMVSVLLTLKNIS